MFHWLNVTVGLVEVLTLAKVVLHNIVMMVNMEFVIVAFICETFETHFEKVQTMGPVGAQQDPLMKILSRISQPSIWINQSLVF